MRPTLRDVAAAAEVSVMTASRALRDSSLLAPETHRRVLEACKKVGYRPHLGARATREQKFRQVACVTLRLGDRNRPAWPVTSTYVNMMAEELADQGYSLVLQPFLISAQDYSFIEPPRVFYESAVDAVIAIASTSKVPDEVHRRLAALDLPLAWLNSGQFKGCLCVMSDERANARLLVDHLIGLGHRRIGYVCSTTGHYSAVDRRDGVVAALEDAGLDTRWCVPLPDASSADTAPSAATAPPSLPGHERMRPIYNACDRLLTQGTAPTAVIGFNQQVLHVICLVANARGYRIPTDLSVSCFASPWLADLPAPPTFVEVPERAIAQHAVQTILKQVDAPTRRARRKLFVGELREGFTTAPPPQG